jgi:hypothetical protein
MALRTSVPVLLVLALSAPGEDKKPEPPPSARLYKSPEAVYAASVAAGEKDDAEAAVHCVAPSAHADLAAFLAFNALTARKLSDKRPRLFAGVLAVLDRHGLTEEATRDVSGTDQKAAVKALAALIKKPIDFAIEMSAAQHEFAAKMGAAKKPKVTHKLTDLKIDGRKATATVVMTLGDQTFEQPMAFVKVGEGWKMLPDFASQPMNLRPKK